MSLSYLVVALKELSSEDPEALSKTFLYLTVTGNFILNCLNLFWASKIVAKFFRIVIYGESQV